MASGRGGDDPQVVRRNFPTWGSDERLAAGQWFRIGLSGVVPLDLTARKSRLVAKCLISGSTKHESPSG